MPSTSKTYFMENMKSVIDFETYYTNIFDHRPPNFTWSSAMQSFNDFGQVGQQIQKYALYIFNPESKAYEKLDTNKLAVLNNGKFIRFGVKSEGSETQLSGITYLVEDLFKYLGFNENVQFCIYGETIIVVAENNKREYICLYYDLTKEKEIRFFCGVNHKDLGPITRNVSKRSTRFVSVFCQIKKENTNLEYWNNVKKEVELVLSSIHDDLHKIQSCRWIIDLDSAIDTFTTSWRNINPALRFHYNEERFREAFNTISGKLVKEYPAPVWRFVVCSNFFLNYAPCKDASNRAIQVYTGTYQKIKNIVIKDVVERINKCL